jgi:hypothetical protein
VNTRSYLVDFASFFLSLPWKPIWPSIQQLDSYHSPARTRSAFPRSRELSTASADGTASADQMPVQKADFCGGTEGQRRRSHVAEFESDYDQVQERWHRDPFRRDNNQSVTKAVQNRKNLEEALYNEGFSQARAAKIAYYMTRCEGQFREWDFIVKKQPRLTNQSFQEESILDSTTETVQTLLGRALNDNSEEDEVEDEGSDGDANEATSSVEEGLQRLRDFQATVTGKVSPAKGITRSRSKKDERQRRRERKANALRMKEYASYTYDDYVQAARRYDIVYGSAEKLYQLAEDHKASRLIHAQRLKNQPTTEMIINGHRVDVEDPTFGLTQPSAEDALTQEEREARNLQNKQLWAEKQRDDLIQSFERQNMLQNTSMIQ